MTRFVPVKIPGDQCWFEVKEYDDFGSRVLHKQEFDTEAEAKRHARARAALGHHSETTLHCKPQHVFRCRGGRKLKCEKVKQ